MQTRKELEDKDELRLKQFDEDSLMEMEEGDILLWRELKAIKYVLADISTHLSKIADKE